MCKWIFVVQTLVQGSTILSNQLSREMTGSLIPLEIPPEPEWNACLWVVLLVAQGDLGYWDIHFQSLRSASTRGSTGVTSLGFLVDHVWQKHLPQKKKALRQRNLRADSWKPCGTMMNWWEGGLGAECCIRVPHVIQGHPSFLFVYFLHHLQPRGSSIWLCWCSLLFWVLLQMQLPSPPATQYSWHWSAQEVFTKFHLMIHIWGATWWIHFNMTLKWNGDDFTSGTYFICRSTYILHPSPLVFDETWESKFFFFVSKPTYSDSIISPCHI